MQPKFGQALDERDREIVSTLVHEMVHQWQHHFGKPSRRSYHNKQWAAKVIEFGLIPSHTGKPGGKQTGQSVSHYIEENGLYDTKWQTLAASGFTLNYQDRQAIDDAGCTHSGPGAAPPSCIRAHCPGHIVML
jgi:hypothetical protein